jgi:hypothetical protein
MIKLLRLFTPLAAILLLAGSVGAQQTAPTEGMYWGDEVPEGWNGNWPAELLTVPRRPTSPAPPACGTSTSSSTP